MKSQIFNVIVGLCGVSALVGCSNDEVFLQPNEPDYKFPALEEICGIQKIWNTQEIVYHASNGQEFTAKEIHALYASGPVAPIFSLNNNDGYRDYFPYENNQIGVDIINYNFNRETGCVYTYHPDFPIKDDTKPYFQILSYDKEQQTIIAKGLYGLIPLRLLTGHEGESGNDKDSYAILTIRPLQLSASDLDKLLNLGEGEYYTID